MSQVERIGGITRTVEENGGQRVATDGDKPSQSIKEQWVCVNSQTSSAGYA